MEFGDVKISPTVASYVVLGIMALGLTLKMMKSGEGPPPKTMKELVGRIDPCANLMVEELRQLCH